MPIPPPGYQWRVGDSQKKRNCLCDWIANRRSESVACALSPKMTAEGESFAAIVSYSEDSYCAE